jgi:hypothetical protein
MAFVKLQGWGRLNPKTWSGVVASVVALLACGGGGSGGMPTAWGGGTSVALSGCQIFPSAAIFNTRIDNTTSFPVHASSSAWKNVIDATGTRRLHLDWGQSEDQSQHSSYWGIPINVVDGTSVHTNWPQVSYSGGVPDESDCAVPDGSGGYNLQRGCQAVATPRLPIPQDASLKVEGGYCPVGQDCGASDHHILVLEAGRCRLWEAYYATGLAEQSANGAWALYGSAAWDLNSLEQRPDTWTSADAAGLPIMPLLVRADEASAGEVKHPLRVTLQASRMAASYVWPARHKAGAGAGAIPFGALLRLRADFVIPSNWTTQAKAVATAMQRYGLYVADIGSDLYIQGEPSAQWQSDTWTQLQSITLSQFDFVSLSAITSLAGFNPNSLAASW